MANLLDLVHADQRLTRAQRHLMLVLVDLADHDGVVRAKVEVMAERCIYCDRQIQRILRQLEASDRLKRLNADSRKRDEPSIYAFYPKSIVPSVSAPIAETEGERSGDILPRQNVTTHTGEERQNVTTLPSQWRQNVTTNREDFAPSANSEQNATPASHGSTSHTHAGSRAQTRADLELINKINSDQQQIAREINPKDQQQQQQHAREDHAYARAMREWARNHGEAKPVVVDELFDLYQRFPLVFEDALKEALRDNKANGHPPINFVRKILERKDRERLANEKRAEALRAPSKTPSYPLHHNDPHRKFQDFINNGRKGETLHDYQRRTN